jgi:cobalt-zinc-cadmium resistance protein CzcA
VRGEGKTPMELRTILEWDIAPRLRACPGVVEVNTFGGELKTYEVELDPADLRARLVAREVDRALQRNNANAGGAYIERHRRAVPGAGRGPDRDARRPRRHR